MSHQDLRDHTGMITLCVDCAKNGKRTPIYNEDTRTRQTLYCKECKKRRVAESVKRSKERQKQRRLEELKQKEVV